VVAVEGCHAADRERVAHDGPESLQLVEAHRLATVAGSRSAQARPLIAARGMGQVQGILRDNAVPAAPWRWRPGYGKKLRETNRILCVKSIALMDRDARGGCDRTEEPQKCGMGIASGGGPCEDVKKRAG